MNAISNNKKHFSLEEDINLLEEKWKNRELFELGIHTSFSTLDGVSKPIDFVIESKKKGYGTIGFTDKFTIQSFPTIDKILTNQKDKPIKIIYGCDMELIDDFSTPILFNKKTIKIDENINDIKYCIFDLETTGFFSEYNEIIEFGYVIIQGETILNQQNFLVKPKEYISEEMKENWYTEINPNELKFSDNIETILNKIKDEIKDCIFVSHNAYNFDFGFLNKAWKNTFKEDFPYPIIDTLPLSKIIFENKRSYSLEKLSNINKKNKIIQNHRALDDSLLLTNLFKKILKELTKQEIDNWDKIDNFQKEKTDNSIKKGVGIKVIIKNQTGLQNLFKLITISHTVLLDKDPKITRSEINKYREGLLIGASGGREGEFLKLFLNYTSDEQKEKNINFYDFIEINSPSSISYLWTNGKLKKEQYENYIKRLIFFANKFKILYIPNNNVHYCDSKEKLIKDILIANKGVKGYRHYLWSEATLEGKKDKFDYLPFQHLLTLRETIKNWIFLGSKILEKLIFLNPEMLVNKIEKIKVSHEELQYEDKEKKWEKELFFLCKFKMEKMFGKNIPEFVTKRFKEEWDIIKTRYTFIYWLSYKLVKETKRKNFIVGSRGSIGSSFIAFLSGITDLNPLPSYKYCNKCKNTELYNYNYITFDCYDYTTYELCNICKDNEIIIEGHNLNHETFFGLKGEKTPDIDLNFSGEYQKHAHEFIRNLLGDKNVSRIGTISALSEKTSELFLNSYLTARKNLNSKSKLEEFYNKSSFSEWKKTLLLNSFVDKQKNIENSIKEWNESEDPLDKKENYTEKIINKLSGIKRTTGQHPGGMIVSPPGVDISYFTPLNYPANNKKSEWLTTHFEYNFLSTIFLKMDILGHDEPTVLQKLIKLTKKDINEISFRDKKIIKLFTDSDTLCLPEFGTDFVINNLLKVLKPTSFSQLVQISGFSHGTNVWAKNQAVFFKKKQLKTEELIACREDVWNFLMRTGIDKKNSFIATEHIRKGKWNVLSADIKQEINSKLLNYPNGKIYLDIISKISYIFPKPHAIAYTMTAWRTAYYKVYFPKQFYTAILSCHAFIFDIWLMTLDNNAIIFYINRLLDDIFQYKNNIKNFISILRVLEELNIYKKKKNLNNENKIIPDLDIDFIMIEAEKSFIASNIKQKEISSFFDNIKKNKNRFSFFKEKISIKEKGLLFTLKIIAEMKMKGLEFKRGVDFNNSEAKEFKIVDEFIYYPIESINGFGSAVSKKIISIRKEKEKINLETIIEPEQKLNTKQIKEILKLKEWNLIL